MNILVHAANLKSAGGLTVALNFLKTVGECFPMHSLVVLAPANCGYEMFESSKISIVIVPSALESPVKRLFLDKKWMKAQISKYRPDVLFTMGNFAIPAQVKQAVVFHYPYTIYPNEKKIWEIFDWKTRLDIRLRVKLMASRFRFADVVLPQTKTAAERLKKYYPGIKKIAVVPNAYTTIQDLVKGEQKETSFFAKKSGHKYLLSLSRYYPHKNLEIFLDVAMLIKAKQLPYVILTTIEREQHPNVSMFLDSITKLGLQDQIINLGNIPMASVPALYMQVEGLLMPTLVESFSTTYADAMYLRKPVFTSDKDFAKDVCGDAAFYFNPLSGESILQTVQDAFANDIDMQCRIDAGYQYATQMADWKQVTGMYMEALQDLVDAS